MSCLFVLSFKIKALTIIQPWVDIILYYGKNVENRKWISHHKGYFAIHSSKKVSKKDFDAAYDEYKISIDPADVEYGVISGFAKMVECIEEKDVTKKTSKWFEGKYGFILEDIILLKNPIEISGNRMFWYLPKPILKKCLVQLSKKDKAKILKSISVKSSWSLF